MPTWRSKDNLQESVLPHGRKLRSSASWQVPLRTELSTRQTQVIAFFLAALGPQACHVSVLSWSSRPSITLKDVFLYVLTLAFNSLC